MADRVYNGRNAGLAVVAATVVVFTLLNLLGRAIRHEPRHPPPVVVTATPTG
ncbi:MAG TPA: hypothetical protein VFQ85_11285 [Mycobacteriales bacterium]|nr:hypothetical protein [Mycobacteriales bacterium]